MNDASDRFVSFSALAVYGGIFFLVIVFAVILQQIGAPTGTITIWMLGFGLSIYIFAGMVTRTMSFRAYREADRAMTPVFTGIAIAAGVISGNLLLLGPGEIYFDASGFLIQFTAILLGLALATILFAAPIARSNRLTLTSILFPQRSNPLLIIISAIVVLACSISLLFAQLKLVGIFIDSMFGIRAETGINILLAFSGFCIVMGGIRSISLTRVIAFAGLAICVLLPLVIISYTVSGNIIPQISFGQDALTAVTEIDRELAEAGLANEADLVNPLTVYQEVNFLDTAAAVLVIAGGIASLPHILQHFTTLQKGRNARAAGVWSFWIVAILLSAIPALAIFTKYGIYTSLLGLQYGEIDLATPWLFEVSGGGKIPFLFICGELVASSAEVIAACGQDVNGALSFDDITVNPEFLTIASGHVSELPLILSVFAGLAGLFCIMTTIDGLLLVSANTLSTDVYRRVLRPRSPPGIRLFINRFCVLLVLFGSAWIFPLVSVGGEVLFSFAMAMGCATIFPMLIARLWVPRFGDAELGVGMIVSFSVVSGLFGSVLVDAFSINPDTINLSLFETGLGNSNLIFGIIGFVCFWLMAFLTSLATSYMSSRRQERRENAPA